MSFGVWEIALILVIVLILFGAGKLPAVMKDLGKGVKSFKDGINDDDEQKELKGKTDKTEEK